MSKLSEGLQKHLAVCQDGTGSWSALEIEVMPADAAEAVAATGLLNGHMTTRTALEVAQWTTLLTHGLKKLVLVSLGYLRACPQLAENGLSSPVALEELLGGFAVVDLLQLMKEAPISFRNHALCRKTIDVLRKHSVLATYAGAANAKSTSL